MKPYLEMNIIERWLDVYRMWRDETHGPIRTALHAWKVAYAGATLYAHMCKRPWFSLRRTGEPT
jgi:hypothetical protein